jgi:hypothetical protein
MKPINLSQPIQMNHWTSETQVAWDLVSSCCHHKISIRFVSILYRPRFLLDPRWGHKRAQSNPIHRSTISPINIWSCDLLAFWDRFNSRWGILLCQSRMQSLMNPRHRSRGQRLDDFWSLIVSDGLSRINLALHTPHSSKKKLPWSSLMNFLGKLAKYI